MGSGAFIGAFGIVAFSKPIGKAGLVLSAPTHPWPHPCLHMGPRKTAPALCQLSFNQCLIDFLIPEQKNAHF